VAPDVEMDEGADDAQIIEAASTAAAVDEAANDGEDVEIMEDELPKRVTFLEYAHSCRPPRFDIEQRADPTPAISSHQ
jgi:hypothetical protein